MRAAIEVDIAAIGIQRARRGGAAGIEQERARGRTDGAGVVNRQRDRVGAGAAITDQGAGVDDAVGAAAIIGKVVPCLGAG